MSRITALFANPWVRLAGRALVAGLAAFFVTLNASDYDASAVQAALVAAALAIVEIVTPLNAIVGLFKEPST